MNNLKEVLLSEIPNFREKSLKFLNGEIPSLSIKVSQVDTVYMHKEIKSLL